MTPSRDPEDLPPATRWSRAPEDLSAEPMLRHCERIDIDGVPRPVLAGRVALLSEIGRGGMGVVYHGVHLGLRKEVAVKLLPIALLSREADAVRRFQREAQLAARLESPHLVRVLDIDQDVPSQCHYFVMEFVRGLSARQWMRQRAEAGLPDASEAQALEIVIAAARGLAVAHAEGVVHRDVKPDNILIPADADGTPHPAQAKLADLGLARGGALGDTLTATSLAMGTPGYMAPEQGEDVRRAKKPADVFSMGCTLYALLTGSAPFAGSSASDALVRTALGRYRPIQDVRPDVSQPTRALIDRCLQTDPQARYPDAPALLDALETCAAAVAAGGPSSEAVTRVLSLVTAAERGLAVPSDSAPQPAPPAQPSPSVRSVGADSLAPVREALAAIGFEPPSAVGQGRAVEPTVRLDAPPRSGSGARAVLIGLALVAVALLVVFAVSGPFGSGSKADAEPPDVATAAPQPPGLYVTSDPSGARVTVDRVPRGLTPQRIENLSDGAHEVLVEMDFYVDDGPRLATTRPGEHVEHPVTLVRAEAPLSVVGGAPLAEVALVRSGPPPRDYRFTLDDTGALAATSVECGVYTVTCVRAGYERFDGSLTVTAAAPARIDAAMAALPGKLSVTSRPAGAELTIDGRAVGKTPQTALELPPGGHTLRLRLASHVERESPVTVDPGGTVTLPLFELTPFGTLDLSRIESDVRVMLAATGRPVADATPFPPGTPIELVLSRKDHAEQRLKIDDVPASRAYRVTPRPWKEFQALLDLASLPAGVTAFVDGTQRSGLIAYTAPRRVSIELRRAGYVPQPVTVELALDARRAPSIGTWVRETGTLDLSGLPAGVVVSLDGNAVVHGQALPAGEYRLVLTREGYGNVALTVTVAAGASAVVVVADSEWKSTRMSFEAALTLLRDLSRWHAASSAERRQAAEAVDVSMDGFSFVKLETFSCGGQTHEVALFTHPTTGLEFVLVPAGTFWMGSPDGETHRQTDEVRHRVTLTQPFLLARTECTQAAWSKAMQTAPSSFKGAELPVETVSWTEATQFCERTGLVLPTEAQWEYACRAGTSTSFAAGDGDSDLARLAWYGANAGGKSHAVASKPANAFGLFDMHGNLLEWCADGYADYPTDRAIDPAGPSGATMIRVFRGGSWIDSAGSARSANRGWSTPDARIASLGFRPCKSVPTN